MRENPTALCDRHDEKRRSLPVDVSETNDRSFALGVSIGTSLLAAIVLFAYRGSRIGFSAESTLSSLVILGMSLWVLNAPTLVSLQWGRGAPRRPKPWYVSPAASMLAALLAVLVTGLMPPALSGWLGGILALAGVAGFVLTAGQAAGDSLLRPSLQGTAGFFAAAGALVGAAWSLGYQSTVFVERLALGSGHQDTLFHSAVAAMIGTYGFPSTGIDGIPLLRYHAGSHYLMSALAGASGLSVIETYQIGYQVFVVPLVVAAVLTVTARTREALGHASLQGWHLARRPWLWMGTALLLTGFNVQSVPGTARLWAVQWVFVSESYGVAILLAAIFAALALEVPVALQRREKPLLLLAFVMPLLATGIGYSKISVLALVLAVLLYAWLRAGLLRSRFVLLGVMLLIASAGLVMALTTSGEAFILEPLHFLNQYVIMDGQGWVGAVIFFVLGHYAWSIVYVALRLGGRRHTVSAPTQRARGLDLEILLLAAFAGAVPGLILNIGGGSAAYFSDVQRYMAGVMILSLWPDLRIVSAPEARPHTMNLPVVLKGVVATATVFVALSLTSQSWTDNLVVREVLAGRSEGGSLARRSVVAYGDISSVESDLERVEAWGLIERLVALRDLPSEDRQSTVLYIPRDSDFWSMSPPGWITFAAPALSETAMVSGLPNGKLATIDAYGFDTYVPRDDSYGSRRPDLSDVSVTAKEMGFHTLELLLPDGVMRIPTGDPLPEGVD